MKKNQKMADSSEVDHVGFVNTWGVVWGWCVVWQGMGGYGGGLDLDTYVAVPMNVRTRVYSCPQELQQQQQASFCDPEEF